METRGDGSADDLSLQEEFLYHLSGDDPAEIDRYLSQHPADAGLLDALRKSFEALAPRLSEWAERKPRLETLVSADSLQVAIPGYRLISVLGKGGMGVVYRAEKLSPRREVALKVIPVGDNPKAKERARREIQAMASLASPNIVTLYESDAADGVFYYSMELLEGETLE